MTIKKIIKKWDTNTLNLFNKQKEDIMAAKRNADIEINKLFILVGGKENLLSEDAELAAMYDNNNKIYNEGIKEIDSFIELGGIEIQYDTSKFEKNSQTLLEQLNAMRKQRATLINKIKNMNQ